MDQAMTQLPRAAPEFEPNYQRMFITAIESLAVIDKALGISDVTHVGGGAHRRGTQRLVAKMDVFCCGSGVAHALCRRFGFDPDEMVKP